MLLPGSAGPPREAGPWGVPQARSNPLRAPFPRGWSGTEWGLSRSGPGHPPGRQPPAGRRSPGSLSAGPGCLDIAPSRLAGRSPHTGCHLRGGAWGPVQAGGCSPATGSPRGQAGPGGRTTDGLCLARLAPAVVEEGRDTPTAVLSSGLGDRSLRRPHQVPAARRAHRYDAQAGRRGPPARADRPPLVVASGDRRGPLLERQAVPSVGRDAYDVSGPHRTSVRRRTTLGRTVPVGIGSACWRRARLASSAPVTSPRVGRADRTPPRPIKGACGGLRQTLDGTQLRTGMHNLAGGRGWGVTGRALGRHAGR